MVGVSGSSDRSKQYYKQAGKDMFNQLL